MRVLPAAIGAGLVCLFPALASAAQQSAGASWDDLRAKNPPRIDLSLRLIDPHSYREDELIRAEIKLPGWSLDPLPHPPAEMWQFSGLLLDPPADCGSLAEPCFHGMRRGVMISGNFGLRNAANSFSDSLNAYLPRLRPGHYRVAVLVRKQVLSRGAMSTNYGYADPPQYAVSNTVEFEVVASTEEWVKQAIAASVATLSAPNGNTHEVYELRKVAAEQLRFLDVPAAWRASLTLLSGQEYAPPEEYILLDGLEATHQPMRVCQLMQEAIPAPSQTVSPYYLNALPRICARADLPPPPSSAKPRPGEKAAEPTPEQLRYQSRYGEYERRVTATAAASLAASLAAKQSGAKAVALQTLLEYVRGIRWNEPPRPLPEWLPAVKAEFVKSLAGIQGWRQRQLLSLYASTVRTPDVIPLLESVLDAWKPGDYYEAPREALQNLYAIDPARAQARIAAELMKERTWLDSPQLAMLPAGAAHFTDDALFEALAAAQRAGGWNLPLRMTALAKYSSRDALPRVRAIYESQYDWCQPELMAYFVRVDPAYADCVFHSHPWDIHVEPPRCTTQFFERTPPIAMGPPLEQYMAAYLMQGQVPLKRAAARSLGRYGSPAAAGPLWDAFRYFHDYWKGKQEELEQLNDGVQLEVELRNAIARGSNWLATEADLRTIDSLCISQRCVSETREDLANWQRPLRIELQGEFDGIRAQVAQYHGISSIDALEEKLGQFPKDTQFLLTARGDGAAEAGARIRNYAAAHGISLVSP